MTEAKSGKRRMRPVHPGEILREDVVPALRRSKSELAVLLGVSRQTLYDVMNGKQPLSPALALRVGKLTNTSAESWGRMQLAYDLQVKRQEMEAELARIPVLEAA